MRVNMKASSSDPALGLGPKLGDPFDILRLIRSRRVGPATFHRLIAEHGTAAAALGALPGVARAAGMTDYSPCPPSVIKTELTAGRRAGARLVTWGCADYPVALRDIPDAPPVLWIKGDPAILSRPLLAMVGARNASSLGLRMARHLAAELGGAGIGIVAGLARGIDTAAHLAALQTGTIAVMAGGIDVIYPSENAALAEAIGKTGLLISEQPPGVAPVARHFPARNRIISGISRAVVVVEAAFRSGSLITARNALDQGREVMAVPGHPLDARAAGCNGLIRDGGLLVRNAGDVLTCLGLLPAASGPVSSHRTTSSTCEDRAASASDPVVQPDPIPRPDELETRILRMLGPHPVDENCLLRDLGVSAAALAPAMLALELSGQVRRLAGGTVARI